MSAMMQEHLEQEIISAPAQARSLAIRTAIDYVAAGELLKAIKTLRTEIDQTFDPIIRKQYEAHKEAVAQKKRHEAPLAEAEGLIKGKIAAYLEAEERRRQDEELRLQKQAAEEAERRQLENAVILDDLGETAEANALLAEPVEAPPVVLRPLAPKVAGIVAQERWDFEVIDINKIPREYLVPDMVKIRRMVTAMRGATSIPGVRVRKITSISARG